MAIFISALTLASARQKKLTIITASRPAFNRSADTTFSRSAVLAFSRHAATAFGRLAISVPPLLAALMLASCGAAPGSPELFQHATIDDVTAEHPTIGDVDLDGNNDVVIVTRYVDEEGWDAANAKDITLYTAPHWEKHVLLTVNYLL